MTDIIHGDNAYKHYKCRCNICRAGHAEKSAEYYATEKGRASQKARTQKYSKSDKGAANNRYRQKKYISRPGGKEIKALKSSIYNMTPKGKEKQRIRKLKRDYGITLMHYENMLVSQNGKCAICSGINENGKRLSVDHNHNTGAVRGLLCHRCNAALGLVKENRSTLINMGEYLNKWDTK